MSRRSYGSGGKMNTESGLTIKVTIPYPPSANRLWRTNKKGVTYANPKYEAWMKEASWAIAAQVKGRQITGPYKMTVRAVRPDKRRRDIDNILKATSDAMVTSGFILDDCNCDHVQAMWVPDDGTPCEVIIETP